MQRSTIRPRARTVLCLLLAVLCLIPITGIRARAAGSSTGGYPSVSITLNGQTLYRRGALVDGEVFVNMYAYTRIFSADTSYTLSGRAVTVYGRGLTVTGEIGSPYIVANGRVLYDADRARVIDGSLWVPLSLMAKASGLTYRRTSETSVSLTGTYKPILSGDRYYDADSVYWLSKIISAESRGEVIEGKIAVGNVILNRTRSSAFPNTIYGVIFDRKYGVQFTPVANGTVYGTATAESVIAAKICLEGYSISGEILYFFHPSYPGHSCWASRNRPYAFSIGGHDFYK